MARGQHHHEHVHQAAPANDNRKAFILGIALNLLFVLAEVIAGLVYHSMALLSDAGHNAGDVASLVLSLVAVLMAKKSSTAQFTYGYKKMTVLAALANAVILLVAVGMLAYASVVRLLRPEVVEGGVIAWIAGLGIIVNGLSALLFYQPGKGDLNVRSAYLHLLADALVSLGVVVAGIIISYTGWYWLDPAVGLVVMVVILAGTWDLLANSFRMSIDAVPEGIVLEDVKKIIRQVRHVQEVGHVHVWPLSTTENALTAHVQVDDRLSFEEMLKVVQEIREELSHHHIHHSTIELGRLNE